MQYPLVAVDGVFRRLIPSKYPTVDLYERFGSAEMQALAAELEKLTNPRLLAKQRIAGEDVSPDTASPKLQNWNHAPLAYPLPEGSYFLPQPYSVMELASTELGALARAILRREAFLSRTQEPICGVDMRMISNRIVGNFVDLRDQPSDMPVDERRKLGRKLFEEGADGIIFRMAEVTGCDFVGIFKLDILNERGVQGAHYRFRYDGQRISRVFNFAANQDVDRSQIFGSPKAAA